MKQYKYPDSESRLPMESLVVISAQAALCRGPTRNTILAYSKTIAVSDY